MIPTLISALLLWWWWWMHAPWLPSSVAAIATTPTPVPVPTFVLEPSARLTALIGSLSSLGTATTVILILTLIASVFLACETRKYVRISQKTYSSVQRPFVLVTPETLTRTQRGHIGRITFKISNSGPVAAIDVTPAVEAVFAADDEVMGRGPLYLGFRSLPLPPTGTQDATGDVSCDRTGWVDDLLPERMIETLEDYEAPITLTLMIATRYKGVDGRGYGHRVEYSFDPRRKRFLFRAYDEIV